jgi:hypothetical protein
MDTGRHESHVNLRQCLGTHVSYWDLARASYSISFFLEEDVLYNPVYSLVVTQRPVFLGDDNISYAHVDGISKFIGYSLEYT